MANVYTWNVLAMTVHKQYQDITDLVYEVQWSCRANNGTFYTEIPGTTFIPYDISHPYIMYADLTEQEVLGWVFDQVDQNFINQTQSQCDQLIQNQIDASATDQTPPPDETKDPPWFAVA
jgi:hypothetical protein